MGSLRVNSPRVAMAIVFFALIFSTTTVDAQLCAPGFYNPNGGLAEGAIQCQPGSFTSIAGALAATPCSPGFYQPLVGQSAQLPAQAGFYVPIAGATLQTPAPAGSYVATTAASAPTLCDPGFFTSVSGASTPTPANPGFYVPIAGATFATPASPGNFVAVAASPSQTPAPHGFYVPISGSSFATPAGVGFFVPTVGASTQTVDPVGTTTPHTASFAVRSSAPTAPRGSNFIVGPIYTGTPTPTIDLTPGPGALTVKNNSTDLGAADSLTQLTLISAALSGPEQSAFQITGFVTNTILNEQATSLINLSMVNPGSLTPGLHTATLTVQTDQSAAFGSPGDAFTYTVQFNAVPEPASLGLVGGMLMLATRRTRRTSN